jgi:hypothetical protein
VPRPSPTTALPERPDQPCPPRPEEATTTHPPSPPRPQPRPVVRAVLRPIPTVVVVAAVLLVALASPAFAQGTSGAPTLSGVIDNLRNWIVGILAGVATLFLTVGGLRYLTAGGDPGQIEKAKTALKSAAIGYALAILAPLLVSILASIVGGG